jgi:imidazole glycerol-phosphate synthase subunit HisF
MLTRRLIVCLDVRDGRVVKGVRFEGLRDVGDPALLARRYEEEGADEIVLLDVSASVSGRPTLLDAVRRTAGQLFIPLTVGGGIRSVEDASTTLRAGADKVAINSAAVSRPQLLSEVADHLGSQAVVASIDARRTRAGWEVFTHGATRATGMDVVAWAERCVQCGAGEILLTSIDADGSRAGYDVELTRTVAQRVSVPVIASGGAGSAEHVSAVLVDGSADAALVAGILHDGVTTVTQLKKNLAAAGTSVRGSVADA